MENIKFYYLADENEPKIIMIDENKKEAFSIDELDLTSIEKIDYPTDDVLDDIVNISAENDYDGSWENIKFVLESPDILEKLALSANREEYISSLTTTCEIKADSPVNILIERFWERFENQSSNLAKKYNSIYKKCVNYLESLSDENITELTLESEKMSNKEYFYLILNKAEIASSKINENHFSF
jgi:hypothetical protein